MSVDGSAFAACDDVYEARVVRSSEVRALLLELNALREKSDASTFTISLGCALLLQLIDESAGQDALDHNIGSVLDVAQALLDHWAQR